MKAGLDLDLHPGLLGESRGQPFQRSFEPEVVECGRAKLDREPAHILESGDDTFTECRNPITESGHVVELLKRLQAEQD